MDELGVDFKSTWTFNDKGDLELVTDEDNMIQSIRNRLTCWLGSFNLFYLEYGSILPSFLGWKREEETLGFMQIEIENTLNQDPRLQDYDLDLDFNDDGGVDVHIMVRFDEEDLDLNLVITTDGTVNILEGDGSISEDNNNDEDYDEDDVG